MPRTLTQLDIVGHRLRRIFAWSPAHQNDYNEILIWFELDNGVVFKLPNFAGEPFEEANLPREAQAIRDAHIDAVLGARIERVLRPAEDLAVVPGTVCLQIEGGRWLYVEELTPVGIIGPGLHVSHVVPSPEDAADFWSRSEA
jgi:hypothetical protein